MASSFPLLPCPSFPLSRIHPVRWRRIQCTVRSLDGSTVQQARPCLPCRKTGPCRRLRSTIHGCTYKSPQGRKHVAAESPPVGVWSVARGRLPPHPVAAAARGGGVQPSSSCRTDPSAGTRVWFAYGSPTSVLQQQDRAARHGAAAAAAAGIMVDGSDGSVEQQLPATCPIHTHPQIPYWTPPSKMTSAGSTDPPVGGPTVLPTPGLVALRVPPPGAASWTFVFSLLSAVCQPQFAPPSPMPLSSVQGPGRPAYQV